MDATADGSSNNVAADVGRQGIADSGGIFDRLFGRGQKSGRITSEPLPDITPPAAISSAPSLVQRVVRASAPKPPPSPLQAQTAANFDVPRDQPQLPPGGPGPAPGFPFSPQQLASPAGPLGMHNMPPVSSLPPFQGIPQFTGPEPPRRQQDDALTRLLTNISSLFEPKTPAGFPAPPNPADLPPVPRPGVPTPPYPMPMASTFQQEVNPFTRQQNMIGLGRRPGYFEQGGPVALARGGMPELMLGLPQRSPFAAGGRHVPDDGTGDGRSDHVPAVLSPGEFVEDAEVVSLLGNGSNAAGAKGYEAIREEIRRLKGPALAKGKISPDAKSPTHYAKVGIRAANKASKRGAR